MNDDELVAPSEVRSGDQIADLTGRWLEVTRVERLGDLVVGSDDPFKPGGGALFAFYGGESDDRLMVSETDPVRRRRA